jgi:putative multiple sugar transport system substrate-binding protein
VRRKFLVALGSAALALSLAACSGEGAGSGGDKSGEKPSDLTIGVSMPTQTSERWIADGNAVKSKLEAKGYKVDLQYAGDDIPTQSQQVDQMITQGADVLVIAAIDGTALNSQLQAAASAAARTSTSTSASTTTRSASPRAPPSSSVSAC